MSQKNTKYTVYEIEKLTNGKLTKYKLTKAILAGELKATKVNAEKKRGRGIPNYFIYESDLNGYLSTLEEKKKHFINVPEDSIYSNSNKQAKEENLKELLVEAIAKITELTNTLKQADQREVPMLNNEENQQDQFKEIVEELASMPSFQVQKRKELLEKLKSAI